MINFTDSQLAAIKSEGSVIVSAGAGCGKTATMIERIVTKLKGGADLKSMLIVTFTRASAADIRVKLAERLVALKAEGGKNRRIAEEALAAMPECDIGTLHSFCQRLIRTYFYAAGVDPSATLVEENEAKLIKSSAVREAVDRALDSDAEFKELCDALGSRRSDNGALKAVSTVLDFALSTENPEKYLDGKKSEREYEAELDGIVEGERAELISRAKSVRDEIAVAGFKELERAIDEIESYLDGKIDAVSDTRYSPKKTDDPGTVAVKRDINERFKALKKACGDHRKFAQKAAEAKSHDGELYSRALKSTAKSAMEIFAAKKARLGKIDYTDLEHGARRVLSDDGCKSEISARIKYVFIDEFQDVNPLQAAIADGLKDCGAEMFLVGDIKQSIYGFRRCSPDFFRDKYNDRDNGYTKVLLTENHRSTSDVIDFVNNVFDNLMTESYGGVDYSTCKLVCASKARGEAEFILVEPDAEKKQTSQKTYSVVNAGEKVSFDPEAVVVAKRIGDYIEAKKPLSLGSIAVLVRSAKGKFVNDLIDLLSRGGIACNVGKKAHLSDYPEAIALLDIARCVDNRYDDLALYTALRSPMGGFDDDELMEIARVGGAAVNPAAKKYLVGGRFCAAVEAYSGRFGERLNAFKVLRDKFLFYAVSHTAADTLGFITSEIGYFPYVYTYYGPSAGAAVQALIKIAADRKCELHSFITFCDKTNFELNVTAGDDAVNILTIHSSKGLEFDYVVVADAARLFKMDDIRGRVIVTENGVAVKVPTVKNGKRTLVPSASWIVESLRGDRIREEELRLFYVALTRAKNKLTVCGKSTQIGVTARCELDFMKNVAAEIAEPLEAPILAAVEKREQKANGEDIERAVKNICDFTYHGNASGKPIKTCVTAIAAGAGEDDYTAATPITFDEYAGEKKGGVDPRIRGTAYHRAMELIDFNAPDFNGIAHLVENVDTVDGGAIERAASEMKKLTDGSDFYFKERYFIADFDGTLVQGVIDLLIVYPDGTCAVVDYKTTSVNHLDTAAYRTQLDLYAKAVEKTTQYRVRAKYLYSFAAGLLKF